MCGRSRQGAEAGCASALGAAEFGHRLLELTLEDAEADEGADSGDEFEPVDGFGEEIIGAEFDGSFNVGDLVERGDNDDGYVLGGGIGLEFAADLEPGHAGHHDIEEDEVRSFGGDGVEGLDAIAGLADVGTEIVEVGREQFEVLLVVVHDEDVGSGEGGLIRACGRWARVRVWGLGG